MNLLLLDHTSQQKFLGQIVLSEKNNGTEITMCLRYRQQKGEWNTHVCYFHRSPMSIQMYTVVKKLFHNLWF